MTETFPRGQRKSRGWSPAAADPPLLMRHISTRHFTFINSGAVQHLEKEMASDCFQTVLTEVNLKSQGFHVDVIVLEVKKIWFIRTTCIVQT